MTRDGRIVVLIVFAALLGSLVLLFVFAQALVPGGTVGASMFPWERGVARVDITGDIIDAEPVVEEIRGWKDDTEARALLVRIESPGGGVAASQEIYEEIARFHETGKPVIASLGSIAASGGYYSALGADEIIAAPGTLTGSIGVIMTLPNTEGLLKKVGVDFQIVKAGAHKDLGSPYHALSADDRAILQGLLDDSYDQFVDAVSKSRHIDRKRVLELADGRVYTGQQALSLGLIDRVGTYHDALVRAGELGGIK